MPTPTTRPRRCLAPLLLATGLAGGCGPGIPEASFSAEGSPTDLLIAEIDAALERVDGAVYTFTEPSIADALRAAQARGVAVRLLIDSTQTATLGPQRDIVASLRLADVPVCERAGVAGGIMHHKFAVIDDRYLLTGSFNWTVSAENSNAEDLLRLDDPLVAERYQQRFDSLWTCGEDGGRPQTTRTATDG